MKRGIFFSLLLSLVVAACAPTATSETVVSPEVGGRAPDFVLETVDGEAISVSDYHGEVVLLNFWATWCGPCRLEMPAFQDRFVESGLEVLAVNFDESPDQVGQFMSELDLDFPAVLDPGGEIQLLYQVRGYPTTYILDADGIIQVAHIGFMNEDQLDGYLSDLGLVN